MNPAAKQLHALQRELALLQAQHLELCHRIGDLYNDGRDEDSFERAFELWELEFRPLLVSIESHQRSIARLMPPAPRPAVNGRVYPRVRRVI